MGMGGANPNAWRNWYHAVGSTYGTWIQGDPRGFRTYRHREHVAGDYRNPPPAGVYAPLFAVCQRKMKHPPVYLSESQRRVVCEAIAARLTGDGNEVVALAVASNHFHLLARFALLDTAARVRCRESLLADGRDPGPRHWLGLARKHASFTLREHGLKPASAVWAARPKLDPVRDREHQVNVARYVWRHTAEGCWVYHFKYGALAPGTAVPGLQGVMALRRSMRRRRRP